MFCKNCGAGLADEAKFCAGCGASTKIQTTVPRPAPPAARSAAEGKPRRKGTGILMLIVSVLLIFIGIGYMALAVAGKTVTAQVTGYEQVLFLNNDDSTRNPSRYKVEYQFTVSGERHTGSVTRVFSGGSHMRQSISVRYLPFWPHVNTEDSGGVNPAGPVMLGAGMLLLMFELKRSFRVGNTECGAKTK